MSTDPGKNLFIDGLALVMNDNGGETITEYARTFGNEAACALFREWLADRIESEDRAASIAQRRRLVRLVPT